MSQEDLAKRLGYRSFTTIQKWESEVSEPPVKALEKMAQIFGVKMDDMARSDLGTALAEKYLSEEERKAMADAISAAKSYYIDKRTAEIAQAIYESRELSLLFDAAKDAKPETLETAHALLLALKNKEV